MSFNPVFVKDHFNTGKWYLYLPADDSGIYWSRWDFHYPKGSVTYNKYFCIQQIMFGIVRPGVRIAAGDSTRGWTESGSWGNSAAGCWNYRTTTTQNNYCEFLIPAGYNRICMVGYDVTGGNGADLAIAWDDSSTTGLDITSYDQGALSTSVREIVIAANASPDGIKKLRITHNDTSGTARIMGLRCWDTDGIGGNPATVSGTTAVGHDMVDAISMTLGTNSPDIRTESVDTTCKKIGGHSSAYEFAIINGPNGGTTKWTGGDQHFGAGSAEYTYFSSQFPNGPLLSLDGQSIGNVWDTTTYPAGKLLTGSTITITSNGYFDWSENDIFNVSAVYEPECEWKYTISSDIISVEINIHWYSTAQVTTSCYSPMFAVNSANASGSLRNTVSGEEKDLSGNAFFSEISEVELKLLSSNASIFVRSLGPNSKMQFDISNTKLYSYIDLNRTRGRASPSNVVWNLGGSWRIRALQSNFSFRSHGDLNNNFQDGLFPVGTGRISMSNEQRNDNALTLNMYSS